MTPFQAWVDTLVATRYEGVASRLAEKLEMSVSAFLRSSRGGTLSIENLLRLADEAGEPAGQVLRMGGKGEIADLIERLFGREATQPLSAEERGLIEAFRDLRETDRPQVLTMVQSIRQHPARPARHTGRR